MSAGDLFLYLAFILAIYCAYNAIWLARGKDPGARRLEKAVLFVFILVSAALLYLLALFLSTDVSVLYVWSNTYRGVDTIYKITGIWAGEQGTILLFVWLISLLLFLQVYSFGKRGWTKFGKHFMAAGTVLLLVLLLITIAAAVFAPTVASSGDAWRLQIYPDGYGMSLELQTPEMALHPPLVFAAYACAAMVMCAAFAFFLTGDKVWSRSALAYGRWAWLLLTAGIVLGAVWAYYVIGWGGYWSWDPVETASLIAWFVFTAMVHALLQNARGGKMPALAPLLGMLAFSASMLVAFVTRAGGVWASSVHVFGQASGSAGERLMAVLSSDPQALGFFLLMLASAAIASYFGYKASGDEAGSKPLKEGIDSHGMTLLSLALMSATVIVMILLLVKNVDLGLAQNFAEFDQKMAIFFVAVIIALAVCLLWKSLGGKKALPAIGVLAVLSVACAAVFAAMNTSWQVGLALPAAILGIWASANRVIKAGSAKGFRRKVMVAAPQVIHLGICLLLISYAASTSMKAIPATGQVSPLEINGSLSAGEYRIVLKQLSEKNITYPQDLRVDLERTAVFDVYTNSGLWISGLAITNLYSSGVPAPVKQQSGVSVQHTLNNDLYMSFDWNTTTGALVQMEVVPMMSFLWSGAALLVLGITMRVLAWHPSMDAEEKVKKGAKSR
jgi:cytochrome c-type biogenesis protein CcmF